MSTTFSDNHDSNEHHTSFDEMTPRKQLGGMLILLLMLLLAIFLQSQ
ncbi:hypothetical protein [Symmachiella dynata]|uniref:Uncharacterized protein n=1 Tax=Symmachiella dynata TaxID=2527995 RepID=A0A517ZQD4_9PLAN|nr:hypothetical protein [Symmachiella dynata]QDT49039.1 hypothetical protein Pan258_30860 [Symmachiella dynata]QDU44706.1 hypothetical protein Mal52_31920 [Symmachiella dynata]|tara:strand:+ start:203 stop:343 length:141 start_codon:yes stop_codon:yes gene_type:complete